MVVYKNKRNMIPALEWLKSMGKERYQECLYYLLFYGYGYVGTSANSRE